MIHPRNSFVVLKLIEAVEKKHGQIVVPANKECYCEAEVMAVGPGTVSAQGGIPETGDLKVGQRVYVKHKEKRQQGQMTQLFDAALPIQDADQTYHMVEQSAIIGIIAQPGEFVKSDLTDKPKSKVSPIIHA